MTKRAVVILMLCLLSLPALAQAASDKNYKQMLRTSPELQEADQSIRDTLDEAKKLLVPADYAEIEKIQAYWERNEFSDNVKAYMESGLNKVEAWAQEIGSHADILARAVEILDLRRKGVGVEGVYEFRKEGTPPRQGMMLVRKVDASYTVEIMVNTGNATDNTCTFSGEGPLLKKRIKAVAEESEAAVTITFDGQVATVKANTTADAQCEKGAALTGKYSK